MVAQESEEMSSFGTSTRDSSLPPSLGFLMERNVRVHASVAAETTSKPRYALCRNLQNSFATKTAASSMDVFER
jgi:hypothetical protein